MTQKLTRNLNDARWREFWSGVDAAAARAPKLHYREPKSGLRRKKKKVDCEGTQSMYPEHSASPSRE